MTEKNKRIGIFSGTFDPVHNGHIAFALEAIKTANLDKVYFAPEVKPRNKPQVTHIAHRVAMLNLAVEDYPMLDVVEFPGKYFLPQRTMTHVVKRFPDAEISLLFGADIFLHLVNFTDQWPYVKNMLNKVELVVSERRDKEVSSLHKEKDKLIYPAQKIWFTKGYKLKTSSKIIRDDLIKGVKTVDCPTSVMEYSVVNWLYHDIRSAKKVAR